MRKGFSRLDGFARGECISDHKSPVMQCFGSTDSQIVDSGCGKRAKTLGCNLSVFSTADNNKKREVHHGLLG